MAEGNVLGMQWMERPFLAIRKENGSNQERRVTANDSRTPEPA